MIGLSNGRQLTVNLWDTEEHANAAIPAMIPVVRRSVEPVLVQKSQVIGRGVWSSARLFDSFCFTYFDRQCSSLFENTGRYVRRVRRPLIISHRHLQFTATKHRPIGALCPLSLNLIIKESGRGMPLLEIPEMIGDASATLVLCYLVCFPIWLSKLANPRK